MHAPRVRGGGEKTRGRKSPRGRGRGAQHSPSGCSVRLSMLGISNDPHPCTARASAHSARRRPCGVPPPAASAPADVREHRATGLEPGGAHCSCRALRPHRNALPSHPLAPHLQKVALLQVGHGGMAGEAHAGGGALCHRATQHGSHDRLIMASPFGDDSTARSSTFAFCRGRAAGNPCTRDVHASIVFPRLCQGGVPLGEAPEN